MTNLPVCRGSASERSISASSVSRSRARRADMNGSTSSWFASSSRKSTSAHGRAADADVHSGTGARPPRPRQETRTEGDATEDEHEPDQLLRGQRLVQEGRPVQEREGRQQVDDEARARRAVQIDHAIVEKRPDRRARDPEREDRRDRLPPGSLRRELSDPERQKHERAGHRLRGGEDEDGHGLDVVLRVQRAGRVAERGGHDSHRPGDSPPSSGRVRPGEHADADEAKQDAGEPRARARSRSSGRAGREARRRSASRRSRSPPSQSRCASGPKRSA